MVDPSSPSAPRDEHCAGVAGRADVLASARRLAILRELCRSPGLSVTDIAERTGIAVSTASGHLRLLMAARLVDADASGRIRFYRTSGPAVDRAVEALTAVAPERTVQPPDPFGWDARTCYDHLAGRLAVAITDALLRRRDIVAKGTGGYSFTRWGQETLGQIGVNLAQMGSWRGAFALPCLDRTERRPHVAGALGAGIAEALADRGWIHVSRGRRRVLVTPAGRFGLLRWLDIEP